MSRSKFVFKQKIVKISEVQQKSIEEMMNSGRFSSEADIFRQALEMFYRKFQPPYLKPTINQEIKIQKREKEIEIQNIPDEEFVAQNLEDVMIYTDTENVKFVLIRWIGNSIGAIPLTEIKTWFADKDDPIVKTHVAMANTGQTPYETFLTFNSTRQFLNERFGVAINWDTKYNGGIYDEELGAVRPN